MAETVGMLHPNRSMFLRESVGTATGDDGTKYELTMGIGANTPMVRSEKTGRYWSISWEELVNLAIEAGINTPEEQQHEETTQHSPQNSVHQRNSEANG